MSNCQDSGCKQYESLINKRLDGEISPEENLKLNAHLLECDECRDEMISLEMVHSLLEDKSNTSVEVPAGFFEKLDAQLPEVKPAPKLSTIFANLFLQTRRSYALAGVSLALVGVLAVGVAAGVSGNFFHPKGNALNSADGLALIETNDGRSMVVSDEQSGEELYEDAIRDLQKGLEDANLAAGEPSSESSGYIRTSYDGDETSSPLY